MASAGDKKKTIADESPKTRKAREKLKKQLDAFDKKITPQALEKKAIEIQRWIARHAPNRVALKTKSISLFDENQNAAGLSQRVGVLADQIRKEFHVNTEDAEQDKMSKLKMLVIRKQNG
ncbi:MAG: hypothetical protein HYX67_05600 [Candidatus Melainabacteria bacterium]|nr:hypothetical protein [Candidatus Melainabacteria bacterium]